MARFEQAVVEALKTLPPEAWQRVDGLMCERPVLALYPTPFASLRLSLMERRGIIESNKFGSFWPSCAHLKSYRLKSRP